MWCCQLSLSSRRTNLHALRDSFWAPASTPRSCWNQIEGRRSSTSIPECAPVHASSDGQPLKGSVALVDGHCLLMRAHLSKKGQLQDRRGYPTGTLFSFTQALLKLRQSCSHVAIMFDAGGPEQLVRCELFPGYKGRRLEVPWMFASRKSASLHQWQHSNGVTSDFQRQLKLCKEACQVFGIEYREEERYEADDLIYTYAKEASRDHFVRIYTVDKDLSQVVGPNVQLHRNMSQMPDAVLDAAGVEERWGVPPELMGDLLALAGDASDSVPGVPGIGPRKAAALLRKHGNLDGVLGAAFSGDLGVRGVGPKLRKSLCDHADQARLMRQVIELQIVPGTDANDFHDNICVKDLNKEWALSFCEEHDFSSLMEHIKDPSVSAHRKFRQKSHVACASLDKVVDERVSQEHRGVIESTVDRSVECEALVSQIHDAKTGTEISHGTSYVTSHPELNEVVLVSNAMEARAMIEMLNRAVDMSKDQVFAVYPMPPSQRRASEPADHILAISLFAGQHLECGKNHRHLWMTIPRTNASEPCHGKLIGALREFFEDSRFRKIYHDFSHSYQVLHAHGLVGRFEDFSHRGFAGDVMHMARLWDPSLASFTEGDYSLAFLRRHILGIDMEAPDVFTSQTSHLEMLDACNAAATLYELWNVLKIKLRQRAWQIQGPHVVPTHMTGSNMWDFYEGCWQGFGELLVEMENVGVPVDRAKLEGLIAETKQKQACFEGHFRAWAMDRLEARHGKQAVSETNIQFMNLNSTSQLRQLFFGTDKKCLEFQGVQVQRHGQGGEGHAKRMRPRDEDGDGIITHDDIIEIKGKQLANLCNEAGIPNSGRVKNRRERFMKHQFSELLAKPYVELRSMCEERGLRIGGAKADLAIRILHPQIAQSKSQRRSPRARVWLHGLGIMPLKTHMTANGVPSVSAEALRAMMKERSAELQQDGVTSIGVLLDLVEAEATLSGFLQPLHKALQEDGRIRPHMNINTETGRLSCRKPNLQNVPVGGTFPVRSVFTAPEGRRFIIADYAQLELRVVAHLANCETMIHVLNTGQDIHSRTAYEMFDHIRNDVDAGRVSLSPCVQNSNIPHIKAAFPEQRRHAKTLNFGVLYGMSAYRMAREWSREEWEAREFIGKWFEAFPEIKKWKATIENTDGAEGVRTLMGRARPLRDLDSPKYQRRGHALRAAVNTPVQGGAADIVTFAMLRLRENEELRRLKYKQILQIHDEIILEGPEEHVDDALSEVVRTMEDPLPFKLRVILKVDARHAQSWHDTQ